MSTLTLSPTIDTSSTSSTSRTAASIPMLSISTSSSGSSSRTLPTLKIPDIDQDSAGSSGSAAAPVPFPRISQRRKLYRGIGTQPWHNKGSDSDSDSETRASRPASVSKASSAHPSPETMPNFDPKRTYSESQIITPNPSLLCAIYATPLIRKKSGEVVKSSLKSPSQSSFGTSSGSFSSQASMPPTPTLERYVRFDGQLEHVRLFHKEQKPAAVSRDGSPQDTETSDNDTLAQSDIAYRSSEDERLRATLVLEAVNIPLRNAMASTQERLGDLDIRLEQVVLSKDGRAVEGTVLVRNIAFEKWIAVRFTYDSWQTTSEVTAKHAKSIPEENTDLFSFVIRLPEVTKRIEEKRLFFALRYLAAGREAWDNNRGENYQLRFRMEKKVKAQPQRTSPSASQHPPSWPVKSANVDQMADLKKELEKVIREDEEANGWDVLTAKLRAKNMHIEEDREAKKDLNFHSRYDFGASSKVKWEPPKELPKYGPPPPETMAVPFPSLRPAHTKATSISGSPSPQTGSWRSPRGSPRDLSTNSAANSPKFFLDPREARNSTGSRPRHHQRGGYFDSYMEGSSKAVLTPTTGARPVEAVDMTPSDSNSSVETVIPSVQISEDNTEVSSSETESTSSSTSSSADNADVSPDQTVARSAVRFNSYPMDKTYLSPPLSSSGPASPSSNMATPTQPLWPLSPQGSLSSVGTTPSITSASSPSQSPSSPSELSDGPRSINQLAPGANRPSLDSLDYSYFLTRFCYYTGHDNTDRHGLTASYGSPHHRRTQSESTMDGHSPSWDANAAVVVSDPVWTPSGSPQFTSPEMDSWSGGSGQATPTRSSTTKSLEGSPGKMTPRAHSPTHVDADLECTPRQQMEYFVRPYRGSL